MSKEKQLPQLKVYDIDYEFLIKNYLDTKYWDKEWCIFVFDNYYYYLSMKSIDTKRRKIEFFLSMKELSNYDGFYKVKSIGIDHFLNNENIKNLQSKIGSGLIKVTDFFEEYNVIMETDDYVNICDSAEYEEERLREIAEEFLDENDVSNDDIREIYIDNYIQENSTLSDRLYDYRLKNQYMHLSNLYLLLVDIFKKDALKNTITQKLENNNIKIKELLEEVEEYKEEMETEEWEETMKDNLGNL